MTTIFFLPLDLELVTTLQLRDKIFREAEAGNTKVSEAFKRATRGEPGAEKVSGYSMHRSMQRRRREKIPPPPTDPVDADRLLKDVRYAGCTFTQHYLGLVQAEEGQFGLVFGSRENINHLGAETKVIQVDGTFRTAPSMARGRFAQILMFHAKFRGHVMPFFKAVMTNKSRPLYDSVFQMIKEVLPEEVVPDIVLTDFESALQGALSAIFPTASVRGCWFHYSQVRNYLIFTFFY